RALADQNEAVRLNPGAALVRFNRAVVFDRQSLWTDAIADYDAALVLDPNYADALLNRSRIYARQRDFRSAIADVDRGALAAPANLEFEVDRCWYRVIANTQFDIARAACDRAVDGLTGNIAALARAFDSRGQLNLKQNRNQEAWRDYDAAARLDDNLPSPLFGRGIAGVRLGRNEEARADFARALELNADMARIYANYGFPIDTSAPDAPAIPHP
ncbi:MAG: tetratricopeptide repeat protein, partial [Hyphomonadaceae bacterium]|nr:tetratricopeptide repeat protein [Hyphomonadaceae bacterium]